MGWIGIDGCRGGWLFVSINQKWKVGVKKTLEELHEILVDAQMVLIDMPIGFPDPQNPVRECDRLARKILEKKRSSVFPVPARETLQAQTFQEANRINNQLLGKGLSLQSWRIVPRLAELDGYLQDRGREINIREAHPEVLFWKLNGEKVIGSGKKTEAGLMDRKKLLEKVFPPTGEIFDFVLTTFPRKVVGRDDILDGLVLAVSALSGKRGLYSLPGKRDYDYKGLPREIVLPLGYGR